MRRDSSDARATAPRGILHTLADLERALLHIQEMATHDELTGLANRRHILDLLEQHALRHARGGPSFYVAMVDLDFFKRINDSHGHATGDEALRTFAREARKQLRSTDVAGRWGGEEFLLLMPETPPGDPNVGLERLRASLAACPASAQAPAVFDRPVALPRRRGHRRHHRARRPGHVCGQGRRTQAHRGPVTALAG